MTQRRSLSDILRNGQRESLAQAWDQTQAAPDLKPLPAGEYLCHLASAELFNAKTNGTPGIKLAFKVIEGQHAGRLVWDDLWLTPAALPMTKRDLTKLGIDRLEHLENPVRPGRIRCRVRVALRMGDDEAMFNRVRSFEVVGIDTPAADAFAPADVPAPDQAGTSADGTPF